MVLILPKMADSLGNASSKDLGCGLRIRTDFLFCYHSWLSLAWSLTCTLLPLLRSSLSPSLTLSPPSYRSWGTRWTTGCPSMSRMWRWRARICLTSRWVGGAESDIEKVGGAEYIEIGMKGRSTRWVGIEKHLWYGKWRWSHWVWQGGWGWWLLIWMDKVTNFIHLCPHSKQSPQDYRNWTSLQNG